MLAISRWYLIVVMILLCLYLTCCCTRCGSRNFSDAVHNEEPTDVDLAAEPL
jgi:hypothetical protein